MAKDRRLLELALKGLEVEKQRLEQEIFNIKRRLKVEPVLKNGKIEEKHSQSRKSRLTAAGRKRLSVLMKARWASGNPPIRHKKKRAA